MSQKILMIIIVVLLLVIGGGGYMVMSKGKGATAAPEVKKAPPVLVTMEERTINLPDPNTMHYLKITLALEVNGLEGGAAGGHGKEKKDAGPMDEHMPMMMDTMINTISRHTFGVLITSKGKLALKEELKEAFNKNLEEDHIEVEEVLFTDFVME